MTDKQKGENVWLKVKVRYVGSLQHHVAFFSSLDSRMFPRCICYKWSLPGMDVVSNVINCGHCFNGQLQSVSGKCSLYENHTVIYYKGNL